VIDPLALFANDRSRARGAADPWANLCVLSTVDSVGNPQSRVVVLRDIERRLAVFINGTSPKHEQLSNSNRHAVLVYFASLGVQYRLTVEFEGVPGAIVRKSWLERPRIPKVMDWLYEQGRAQSSEVDSREVIVDRYAELDEALPKSVEAPSQAVGYFLVIEQIERLELAGDRIHSRQRYRSVGSRWQSKELIP
jgi:pyridoxine/pyridoxamine 5'-phosphate oxidase